MSVRNYSVVGDGELYEQDEDEDQEGGEEQPDQEGGDGRGRYPPEKEDSEPSNSDLSSLDSSTIKMGIVINIQALAEAAGTVLREKRVPANAIRDVTGYIEIDMEADTKRKDHQIIEIRVPTIDVAHRAENLFGSKCKHTRWVM